jgi:CRP/FNR family transcriptional regulator, anaerobic regulatory protein
MGDTGHEVYVLRSGVVKLVGYSSGGVERIVGLLEAGHMLGLETLVRGPFRHTAVAMSDIGVCAVRAEDIRSVGRTRPEFREQLLREFQWRLNAADAFLTELSTGTVRARVARLFLFLGKKRGESPFVPREDMAMLLGCTTETASRVVADFKRRGLVHVLGDQSHVCRCDVERLSAIAAA